LAAAADYAEVRAKLRSRIEARIIEAELPAKGLKFIPPSPTDKGGAMDHSNS
jgi:hypothetical protein